MIKITPWEALRQVEWISGTEDGLYDHHCPYCHRWQRVGHASDCIVDVALSSKFRLTSLAAHEMMNIEGGTKT